MNTEKDLEYIDSYLEGTLTKEEQSGFENRLSEDKEFNEAYQFILSVRDASKIADEVRRIKEMLNDENLGNLGNDKTLEGKVISFKQTDDESWLEQDEVTVQSKSFSLWPYLKYAGIAATIAVIFLVWQPTKHSNEEIFASYTSGELDIPKIAKLESSSSYGMEPIQGSLRGGESKPENYTNDEWQVIMGAIEMVNNGEYSRAKKIFSSTLNSDERNSELLIYYAIAQLHSNEVENAISILEQLKSVNESYSEYVSFHLAMGYIKVGKVRDARALLKTVKNNGGELSREASTVLSNMRWF